MELLDALGRLIQIGGIGGSLAFLYLGYSLLKTELGRLTPAGKPSPLRDTAIATIKSFIRTSLIFFLFGVLAELALSGKVFSMFEILRNHISQEVTRARLVSWGVTQNNKTIFFKLSAVRFDQEAFIPDSTLKNYKIVVAAREATAVPDNVGSYPIFFGKYDFPISEQPEIQEPLKPAKAELILHKCVKIVVFGLPADTNIPASDQEFNPSDFGEAAKVFSWQTFGPDELHC